MTTKLHSAEFVFDNHKVTFVGSLIVVEQFIGDRWTQIHEKRNRWVGRGRENDGVMGREYKPRVTDALNVLNKKPRKQRIGL